MMMAALVTIDYKLAMSAGHDAAAKQAKKAGREAWNEDDWNLMAETVQSLTYRYCKLCNYDWYLGEDRIFHDPNCIASQAKGGSKQ
jgi:hypothetical protein